VTSPFLPGPCPSCGGGGAGAGARDVEQTLLCDVDAQGNRIGTAIMVQQYDGTTGAPVGVPTPINPATGAPYAVVGTLVPCDEAGAEVEQQRLCDVQTDNSAIIFIRHYVYDTDSGALLSNYATLPDGTVYAPTGTVMDCDPYRTCTPDSSIDVNGNCGPGQVADPAIIAAEGESSDSVITDDPTADPLCGGTWDRPAEPQPAPFPVQESFRNATFDQPPAITQGTAPFACLTASPGCENVDTPGNGWLQMSDINSFTNGMYQLVTPFPNTLGVTAGATFASHDGTAQGGDGMAVTFTDGAEPGGQGIPIGGGGSLGLANWEGGYVGVVLDEYGGANGVGNSISIHKIGAAGLQCTTPISLAPHQLNATTRAAPARVITSIITEAGQTYVSASILWPGDTEPTVYFNRFNVTACAGPAPATLRMGLYGGSGGAFRSEHEFRDLAANAAGVQDWRAFPITSDPIPACATNVAVKVCVDVTFTSDSQTVGNANPEVFLWLVNDVTNTVLDKAELSSQPSQVGTVHNICVTKTVPKADLPNLRFYVGAETRDASGTYGTAWENLNVDVTALGCPSVAQRTLAISAPCPIPVTVVGGGTDGGGGGNTVVNTAPTFEDAEVCIQVGTTRFNGFRREVRGADGTITLSFLSFDGVPVTPDAWAPGACPCVDTELLELCDFGTNPATPFVRRVSYDCFGQVASAQDVNYVGLPYGPVGTVGRCPDSPCNAPTPLGEFCFADGSGVHAGVSIRECDGTVHFFRQDTGAEVVAPVVVVCPEKFQQFQVFCDLGNGNHQFLRQYFTSGGTVFTANLELDGTTAYLPVGPISDECPEAGAATRDSEAFILCDSAATPNRFIRTRVYDAAGAIVTTVDTTLAGAPFVPTGAVGVCSTPTTTDFDFTTQILCDANATPFIQRLTYNSATGAVTATTNTTLTGGAFVPVGAVGLCSQCCPAVIGNGCTNVGSGFYTAIRNVNATISLIDSVTGAVVAAVNIIPCPTDNTVRTLTSQARILTNATPWTPGADVVGTLTSVSFTGLTGTWDLVDANSTAVGPLPAGASVGWNAEDDNILTGPQSVTPAAGGTVLASWTQR
jgi:hypothetical protein